MARRSCGGWGRGVRCFGIRCKLLAVTQYGLPVIEMHFCEVPPVSDLAAVKVQLCGHSPGTLPQARYVKLAKSIGTKQKPSEAPPWLGIMWNNTPPAPSHISPHAWQEAMKRISWTRRGQQQQEDTIAQARPNPRIIMQIVPVPNAKAVYTQCTQCTRGIDFPRVRRPGFTLENRTVANC